MFLIPLLTGLRRRERRFESCRGRPRFGGSEALPDASAVDLPDSWCQISFHRDATRDRCSNPFAAQGASDATEAMEHRSPLRNVTLPATGIVSPTGTARTGSVVI